MSSRGPLRAERRGAAPSKGRARAAPARARKPRRARRGGPLRRLLSWPLRVAWALSWRLGLVAALILGLAVGTVALRLPGVAEIADGRVRGSVTMLDRDGRPFAWRGEQFGGLVTAETVAPVLIDAIVATEDRRFYYHPGVDPIGVASAVRINLTEGRSALDGHGGSTLTQQTAKLLCLGRPFDADTWDSEADYEADCRRSTIERKAREAIFAMAMELRYTKEEILTIYLNRAFLGAGARGFEAASRRYFGHSASRLDAAEAAMLAGLLVAPTRYAPTGSLSRAQGRAATVIRLMEAQGYLTPAEAQAAIDAPATLTASATQDTGGHFADWVMTAGPQYLTTGTTEDVVIRTTLDPSVQAAAEAAVEAVFARDVREGSQAQAAIVVMDADGAVRAMVGGRDMSAGGFNRAVQAQRQPGSAFKPFVYAAALDLGHSPLATVVDEPLAIAVPGAGTYSPQNYDRRYRGRVTLAEALASSLNTVAVRVSEAVGRENVRRIAADFGLRSDLADGPALALGVSETTLIEMTGAYAGILNGGRSVRPYGLVALDVEGERLMDQSGGLGERVVSEEAARQLVWMMHRGVEEGTGERARLPDGRQVAGKTGTTQAARDAWFVGFTADTVAGVWMGYDDNTPLSGVTGGGLPAQIWREAMARIEADRPARALPMSPPVAGAPARAPAGEVAGYGAGYGAEYGAAYDAVPQPLPEPGGGAADRSVFDALRGLFRR